MVDQSQMEAYRRANHHLEKALRSEIDAVWKALAGGTPEQIRDGLLDTIPALIDKYGKASAELAAEWFEELVGEAALVEDAYRPEAWRASTRWALDPIFKETKDYEAALTRVASVAVRFARQHGRDVVDSSVRKYPHVLYARVPSGSHTCSFCMILASRGPVYGTKQDAGGPGNRYHTDCDCMVVPMRGRWEPDRTAPSGMRWHGEKVDGYDHEKLYVDEYKPYWRDGDSIEAVIRRRDKAIALAEKRKREARKGILVKPRKPTKVIFEPGAERGAKPQDIVTAETLAHHGFTVVIKAIDRTPGAKNPDYLIGGEVWEMKAPEGSSEKNTISGQFKRARKQASRMVLDLGRIKLDERVAKSQAIERFYGQNKLTHLLIVTKSREVFLYSLG
ncbi:VG15 protein [Trueperella pyogenes]